jgi:hypothetical protein
MRFQKRDGAILTAIYEYDGVLARRHLKRLFWPDATLRAMQKRLAKLIGSGYLAKPTPHQRRTQPIPEPVYWLGWKGIIWVAGQYDVVVDPPANQGENQMRKLAKNLRDQGIRWLREPRWIQLAHDLAVVDFRMAVEKAVNELPALNLEEWKHESEFRCDGDAVAYKTTGRDGMVKQMEKRVYPDSYFVIVDERRLAQGLLARARFLLELDNATHPNERFGREKVVPGVAYINSPEYKARFGDNSGRWLVVTTGEVRMSNLMDQVQRVTRGGATLFLFTTFDKSQSGNVLTKHIWRQEGKEEPIPLFARN